MWWEREECCDASVVFELVTYIFIAGSITCLLMALHRIAAALKLGARVQALGSVGDSLPAEEREILVRKVAASAMRYV